MLFCCFLLVFPFSVCDLGRLRGGLGGHFWSLEVHRWINRECFPVARISVRASSAEARPRGDPSRTKKYRKTPFSWEARSRDPATEGASWWPETDRGGEISMDRPKKSSNGGSGAELWPIRSRIGPKTVSRPDLGSPKPRFLKRFSTKSARTRLQRLRSSASRVCRY